MTSATLKCPMCSSTEISVEGEFASFENAARYRYMGKKSTFKRKDLYVAARSARFCLECNYMMLFAAKEEVDQLASAMREAK